MARHAPISLPLSTSGMLGILLAACTTSRAPPPVAPPPTNGASVELLPADAIPTAWEEVITPADKDRLARTEQAWSEALAEARQAGFSADIAGEGPLLDPAAALPRPAPPPGPYMCRVVKLGIPAAEARRRGRAFAAYKPFNCYIEAEGALLTIVKQSGSQRPAGRLWQDGESRLVFLGTMERDQEAAPPAYATDADRDLAGYVERVAPFRWRLAIPWPQQDSILDILELIPIPPETRLN